MANNEENEGFDPDTSEHFYPGQDVPPDVRFRGAGPGSVQPPPPPAGSTANIGAFNDRNNAQYFKALRRQGYFMTEPFVATANVQTLRPLESRTYLFIQNIGSVGDILIGFGNHPSSSNNLTLTPGSAYEPFTVPINDIYIISSVGSVAGFLIYSREVD